MSYFGGQDNFSFEIVLLDRFDCTNFVFATKSTTYSEHDMIISRLVPAITRLKYADKGLQKSVPLGTTSDAYAFLWANLVKNVIF